MDRIKTLLEFLSADPGDSFSRYALGLEYRSAGDLERAIETYQEVLRRDPDYLATYYQLAKAYQDSGELDQARATFQAGIELASRQGDLHTREELQEALGELEN